MTLWQLWCLLMPLWQPWWLIIDDFLTILMTVWGIWGLKAWLYFEWCTLKGTYFKYIQYSPRPKHNFEFWRGISVLTLHYCGLLKCEVAWIYKRKVPIAEKWKFLFLCWQKSKQNMRLVRYLTYEKSAKI